MLINRNNYETFFLLYADDELPADERKAVEVFVNENEDLKRELQMLLSAVLPVEEIVFTDKSFLYKNIVFNEMLQEKLLLKIDNELCSSDVDAVNNMIATDEKVLNEYNSLLAAKLNPAHKIVFKEKHLLYKKERDNVIVLRMIRWAAAAILIGSGLFFGVKFFTKKAAVDSSVAINTTDKIKTGNTKSMPVITNNDQNSNVEKTVLQSLKKESIKNTGEQNIAHANEPDNKKADDKIVKKEKVTDNNVVVKEEVLAINKNSEKVQPATNITTKEEALEVLAANKKVTKDIPAPENENIVPLENTYAKAASFTEEEKTNNKIFYFDEDEVKRSKVGGFFKKVKRLVERTAKIKTGNSISIAGFEIASK